MKVEDGNGVVSYNFNKMEGWLDKQPRVKVELV